MARNQPSSILVIEDEEQLADLFARWLRERFDVETVSSGESALEALAERSFDVILLDRNLPDISGDSVLVTLRDRGIDTPVAMVTGVKPETDVVDLGFDDYLLKPVSRERLLETVDRLMETPSYDSLWRELSSLKVKRNILEVEYAPKELATNDRYQSLQTRIEKLESREIELRTHLEQAPPMTTP